MFNRTVFMKRSVLVAVLAIILAAGNFPAQHPAIAAPSSQTEKVALSLEPSNIEVAKGDLFDIDILIDTRDQAVAGINAFVNFDPAFLEVQDSDSGVPGVQIQGLGNFANEIKNEADNAAGEIDYLAGGTSVVEGSFVLATITFRALEVTSSSGTGLAFSSAPSFRVTFPYDLVGTPISSIQAGSTVQILETDLSISKTASPSPLVIAGETITYSITVTNNGPSGATGVTVTDAIPESTSFVSASSSDGSGAYDDTTGIWNAGNLANRDLATLMLTVKVDSSATDTITNTAVVSDQFDPLTSNNSTTAQTSVGSLSNLKLEKTGAPNPVVAGNQLEYVITVTNDGPSDASGVQVTESIPDEIIIESVASDAGSFDEQAGLWDIGLLAAGRSEVLTIVATVASSATENSIVVNSATVSAVTPDSNTGNNTATSEVAITTSADLRVKKDASSDTVIAGEQLSYALTVTNNGPSDASDVRVTDSLPDGLTLVSAAPDIGEFDEQSGVWNVGDLINGQSVDLQIVALVEAGTPENAVIENNAAVDASTPDSGETNNSAMSEVGVITRADLEVRKEADVDAVVAGQDQITYTTTVSNNGPSDALNVIVTDLMPASLNLETVTKSRGDFDEETGEWAVGLLPNGQSTSLNIVATVSVDTPNGTNLVNQANATSTTADPDNSNNSDKVVVTIEREADLSIDKKADLSTVVAGERLIYTITVTNNGPDPATGVIVTDTLPEGAALDADASSAGCAVTDSTVTCTVDELIPGEDALVTLGVEVASSMRHGSALSNAAEVDSDQVDRNPGNDSSIPVVTQVIANADLSVTQEASPASGTIGSQLTYTITVTNAGPSDADGVVVTDTLPQQVEFVSASDPNFDEGTGEWNVGNLPAGQSTPLSLIVNIPVDIAMNSTLTNTVEVSGAQEDPSSANNSNTMGIAVTVDADLSITIEDDADPIVAGGKLAYTITISNIGPSIATGVAVTDTLPEGVSFDSAAASQGSFDSATKKWSVGGLNVGESQTLELAVAVNQSTSGTIINTVKAVAEQPDQNATNDIAIEATQVASPLDMASGIVSPASASTVDTGSGDPVEASVEIPAASLEQELKITVRTVSSRDAALPALPDIDAALSRVVNLSPGGLQLSKPVTINISYSDQDVVGIDENTLLPLLLADGEWMPISETCPAELKAPLNPCLFERRPDANSLIIKSSHFSTFAIQSAGIKVVTVTSDKETKPGDSYLVVVSAPGKNPETTDGTSLTKIADVSQLLVRMHGLDRVGPDQSTHVLLATVPSNAPKGLMPIEINLDDGTSLSVNLNVVSERTNRNLYLFPGLNFTGLGLLPDDTSIDNLLNQPVTNANPEFVSLVGRTVKLADIVKRVFAFDEVEDAQGNRAATFLMNNTTHPCAAPTATCNDPTEGITPADSLNELQPYQGMIVETRTTVELDAEESEPVNVFDLVDVARLQSRIAAPIKMNIRGRFLDLDLIDDEGSPSIPLSITKQLRPGFNLIAPHVAKSASFDTVFSGALEPHSLADRAFTHRRKIDPLATGTIIDIDFVEESVAISGAEKVEPEFSYWIFIKNFVTQDGKEIEVRPTITPLGQ